VVISSDELSVLKIWEWRAEMKRAQDFMSVARVEIIRAGREILGSTVR